MGDETTKIQVATANVTSYGSLMRALHGDFDVILIQEVRISQERVAWLWDKVSKLGWSSFWSAATPTGRGGLSGGVGVVWKKHISVVRQPEVIWKARMVSVALRWQGTVIDCMSVYGFTGDALGEDNQKLLRTMAKHVMESPHQFVAGGDYNATNVLVEKWVDENLCRAKVVHSGTPTCYAGEQPSCIDFFIVSKPLNLIVEKPVIRQHCEIATHRVVSMAMGIRTIDHMVEVLTKLPRPPGCPVVGPQLPQSIEWKSWQEEATEHMEKNCADLDQGMCLAKREASKHHQHMQKLVEEFLRVSWLEVQPMFGLEHKPGEVYKVKKIKLSELLQPKKQLQEVGELALYRWLVNSLVQ